MSMFMWSELSHNVRHSRWTVRGLRVENDFHLSTLYSRNSTCWQNRIAISFRQVKQPRSQWQPYRTVRVRNSLVGCVRIFKPGIMAHIQGSIIIRFELIRCEWWCCGFLIFKIRWHNGIKKIKKKRCYSNQVSAREEESIYNTIWYYGNEGIRVHIEKT